MEADQHQEKSFNMGSEEHGRTPSPSTLSLNCQESNHMKNCDTFEGGNYESFAYHDISNNSVSRMNNNGNGNCIYQRPLRACTSPISSIVGTALHQLNLKRSSSAPMINQMGTASDIPLSKPGTGGGSTNKFVSTATSSVTSGTVSPVANKEPVEKEKLSHATSFLATFNNGGPRPRRFSASFSPGSPNPAPSRVNQLRHENTTDWEAASEKEFHGANTMAQSWEDLSLDSMNMDVATRRPSFSDQLWLSMPPASSGSVSASSSPAASPRVLSRFSPSLSSPSPTRKSFTTRRSLSPIAVRPSVLTIGHGVKRKVDWDAGTSPMDCSPQPPKRSGGLLGFQCSNSTSSYPTTPLVSNHHSLYSATSFHSNSSSISTISMITNHVEDSPNSFETESSVSSNGGRDSPFFRPVDSPITVLVSPDDSHQSTTPKP